MNALTLIQDNKSIAEYKADLKALILNGDVNPLTAFINISKFLEVIKEVKEDESIRDAAAKEYQKYGQKDVQLGDCIVTEREAGVKWDFSECGDTIWSNYDEAEKEAKEGRKDREQFLKTLKEETSLSSNSTEGELLNLKPPHRTSKTSLVLTFKK